MPAWKLNTRKFFRSSQYPLKMQRQVTGHVYRPGPCVVREKSKSSTTVVASAVCEGRKVDVFVSCYISDTILVSVIEFEQIL
jgi:hypothetical protein